MNNFTITISAAEVAWYGAIVATISVIINLLNFLENKVNVKVTVRSGYRVFNGYPPYEPDIDYIVVTVINKGKRPVTIGSVGFIAKNNKGNNGILSDSFLTGIREINEGKSTQYLIKEKEIDISKIKYFAAYDLTGRIFKGKLKNKKN